MERARRKFDPAGAAGLLQVPEFVNESYYIVGHGQPEGRRAGPDLI